MGSPGFTIEPDQIAFTENDADVGVESPGHRHHPVPIVEREPFPAIGKRHEPRAESEAPLHHAGVACSLRRMVVEEHDAQRVAGHQGHVATDATRAPFSDQRVEIVLLDLELAPTLP